jgi:4-hydroxy-tetrahydrodipicolinate reductase
VKKYINEEFSLLHGVIIMKIAIIGYGGMGKMIENIAKERGIEVVSIIDPEAEGATHKEINQESLKDVDVAIEFTAPNVAVENIKKVAALKVNMVVGTTAWYDNLDEVKAQVEKKDIGFIYGSNFSVGVHSYFRILEAAAKLFNNIEEYDVWGHA